jgi:hypothetical protein
LEDFFFTLLLPLNDDHDGNYNNCNKEFVEDQPWTFKEAKRKSKPAAQHGPRRPPLSVYNIFFSEEKDFAVVVALLPHRYAATGDHHASTTITTASSSTSEDVVTSPLPGDYGPKNINAPSLR